MKLGDKAKQIIRAVAPTAGTILGGPVGGLVGAIIAQIFGTTDEKAIEEQILTASPDVLLKLKQVESETKIKLRELDIDEEKIAVEDRLSARQMATATNFYPQALLTAIFLAGYFSVMGMFLFGLVELNLEYKELLISLIYIITGSVPQLLSFWFGSSAGSRAKTDVISAIAKE